MLFVLYGGIAEMGKISRDYFRNSGFHIIKKYNYSASVSHAVPAYEPRNYVSSREDFLDKTVPAYRYTVGGVEVGVDYDELFEALTSPRDYLLTMSSNDAAFLPKLKSVFKDKAKFIYVYIDNSTLTNIVQSLNVSELEKKTRLEIGQSIKRVYSQNKALFDYKIIYGGEESDFNIENLLDEYRLITDTTAQTPGLIDMLNAIKKDTEKIKYSTQRMEEQLNKLVQFMEGDLQIWLSTEKQKLAVSSNAANEEQIVSSFIDASASYINRNIQSSNKVIQQEADYLKSIFGNTWNRLLATTQVSLISAHALWKYCANIATESFDFSGVCISATSALEAELKRVFYTGFQEYLESRYGTPNADDWKTTFNNWPEKLLSCTQHDFKKMYDQFSSGQRKKKPVLTKGDSFTMGVLPYIFGRPEKYRTPEQSALLDSRLTEYLSTIVTSTHSSNPIKAFYDDKNERCLVHRSEHIRADYRNAAAHVDVISRNQAKECYQHVIGKIDALEYASDVTGLIIDMYDKLRC